MLELAFVTSEVRSKALSEVLEVLVLRFMVSSGKLLSRSAYLNQHTLIPLVASKSLKVPPLELALAFAIALLEDLRSFNQRISHPR
jgi:hypothetical protein